MIPVLNDVMIDAIEKQYKETYKNMVDIHRNMYESAEKYRYEMQQYVAALRKMNRGKEDG